jgi:hypothetical protein
MNKKIIDGGSVVLNYTDPIVGIYLQKSLINSFIIINNNEIDNE